MRSGRGITVAVVVVGLAAVVALWLTWPATQPPDALSVETFAGPATTSPTTTTTSAPTTTSTTPLPACVVGDVPVEGDPLAEWATMVVDTERTLPENFAPPDLVEVVEAGFDSADQVRQIVIDDLAALREAAEADGASLIVVSAYRSHEYQANLYQEKVNEVGEEAAVAQTARAGHSEHQLGTAVDVLNPEASELTLAFADTPQGRWVAAHAHEYGFVLSYPNNGRDKTCQDYEPWHLRYVGRDLAMQIHESGLAPREWLLTGRR